MSRRLVTIRGIIIASSWDEKGNVTTTAIATHDENEYVIDGQENGEKYLDLLRKEVEIKGWLREKGGKKLIKIKTFRAVRQTPLTD